MTHHLANYTLQAMLHLAMDEFTTPEREQKLGVMVSDFIFLLLLLYSIIYFSILLSYLALA